MTRDGYTKEEVITAGNGFPEKGTVCPKCGARIPIFVDLSPENEAEIRDLIAKDQKILAMERLQRYTGCCIRWSKIWVLHPDGPNAQSR